MNIFIDFALGKIEKVTPAPIYFGNNNVDKITLYFKNVASGIEWYPTLSALCSDNNQIYPRLSDTSGTGTKTIDDVEYTYFEFTLSTSNGWNLTPGRILFYVWINYAANNGNKCVGSFGCTIMATSGYYQIDNPVVNPELREYLELNFQEQYDFISDFIGGEPRYVDTSTNILAHTTNEGIAVGTDDNHWYYWDGTQYVDSGFVYQAISDESIVTSKIADAAITNTKLAANSVTTTKIEDGAVISDKLASSSVTTSKIADGNVSNAKLSDNSVTTPKIANGAITIDKISDSTINYINRNLGYVELEWNDDFEWELDSSQILETKKKYCIITIVDGTIRSVYYKTIQKDSLAQAEHYVKFKPILDGVSVLNDGRALISNSVTITVDTNTGHCSTNDNVVANLYTKNKTDELLQAKLDKTAVYNALDQTLEGYVLDARQGKVLKDALDTLYNYVGYATESDSDTVINKLREIFAFLAGASDDETLLDLIDTKLALKADLINANQTITAKEVKTKKVSSTTSLKIEADELEISANTDSIPKFTFGDTTGNNTKYGVYYFDNAGFDFYFSQKTGANTSQLLHSISFTPNGELYIDGQKLSADLIDDTNATHKFVSASEKATWNDKQDTISGSESIDVTNNVVSVKDTYKNSIVQESNAYTDKQIKDLKWYLGGYDLSVGSDNQAKYQKALPSGTIALELNQIGGMSYKYNQLVQNGNFATATGWGVNVGTLSFANNTLTLSSGTGNRNSLIKDISGLATLNHKYLITFNYKSNKSFYLQWLSGNNSVNTSNNFTNYSLIGTYSNSAFGTSQYLYNYDDLTDNEWVLELQNFMIFDLTNDFGAGNEPSTIVEARALYKPRGVNLDEYNAYSSGEIRDTKTTSVKLSGFNVWDEVWELGKYDVNTGEPITDNTQIRSKNYIKVLPNTTYYFNGNSYAIYFLQYDVNKRFLGWDYAINQTKTIGSNVHYIRFYMLSNYGTTYNNDICINISGSDNGTYKPYQTPIQVNIPSEIQALEGYGMTNNYIDFNSKKYTQGRKAYTFTGEETFSDRGTNQAGLQIYSCDVKTFMDYKIPINLDTVENYLGETTGVGIIQSDSDSKGFRLYNNSTNPDSRLIYFIGYTLTQIVGVYIEYDISTPVETDISAYLPSGFNNIATNDNYTDLELANQFNADMPNSVSYLIEEVKSNE